MSKPAPMRACLQLCGGLGHPRMLAWPHAFSIACAQDDTLPPSLDWPFDWHMPPRAHAQHQFHRSSLLARAARASFRLRSPPPPPAADSSTHSDDYDDAYNVHSISFKGGNAYGAGREGHGDWMLNSVHPDEGGEGEGERSVPPSRITHSGVATSVPCGSEQHDAEACSVDLGASGRPLLDSNEVGGSTAGDEQGQDVSLDVVSSTEQDDDGGSRVGDGVALEHEPFAGVPEQAPIQSSSSGWSSSIGEKARTLLYGRGS